MIPERELLHFAAYHARCEILRHTIAESCIVSTRIVTSIYHEMGVPCVPLVVGAVAVNKQAYEKYEQGEQPHIGDDEGSFALRIPHVYQDDPEKWKVPEDKWPAGHIVLAAANRYLVDPSADQMSFPEKGITLGPLIIDLGDAYEAVVEGDHEPHVETDQGAHLQYMPFPDDTSYLTAEDWQTLIEGDPLFDRVRSQVLGLVEMVQDAGELPRALPKLPRSVRSSEFGRSRESIEMAARSLQELHGTLGPEHRRVSDSEVARRRAEALFRGR